MKVTKIKSTGLNRLLKNRITVQIKKLFSPCERDRGRDAKLVLVNEDAYFMYVSKLIKRSDKVSATRSPHGESLLFQQSVRFVCALLFLTVALFFSCKVTDPGSTSDSSTGGTSTTGGGSTGGGGDNPSGGSTQNLHTVTIVLNNGEGISELTPKVEDGKTLTLTSPTRAGYVFKGWSTTDQLSNLDFTSSYMVKNDMTIYAMFNKLYTVTIDTKGGTVPTTSYPVEAGSSFTLTELPTRAASTFDGYKDGGNNPISLNTAFVVNDNMTLTAQWTVDLFAVRDILTGGTTGGLNWPSVSSKYTTTIKFSMIDNTTLEIIANITIGSATNTMNTTLVASTNGDLARFNPSLTVIPYMTGKDMITSIINIQDNYATVRLNGAAVNTAVYTK